MNGQAVLDGFLRLLPSEAVDNFRYRGSVRREARLLISRMGAGTALEEVTTIRRLAQDPQVRAFAYNVEREIRESTFDAVALDVQTRDIRASLVAAREEEQAGRIALATPDGRPFDCAGLIAQFRLALLSPEALLTERQLECLEWVAQGKSSADIAGILGLSKRTVDEHLSVVCEKLGVKSRVQAVRKLSSINGVTPAP